MSHTYHSPFSGHNPAQSTRGKLLFAEPTTNVAELAQRVFSQSCDGFFEWRPLNNQFTFSPSFSQLLGYVSGRLPLNVASIAAHIYSDDYPTVKLFLAKTLLSGADGTLKFRMIKQDVSVSWFQLHLRVTEHDETGRVECALVSISNIDHVADSLSAIKTQAENEQWLRMTIRQLLQRQDDEALDDCLNQFCNRVGIDHMVLRQAYRDGERYRLVAKGHNKRISGTLDYSHIILRKHMPYEFSEAEQGKTVLIDDFEQVASLSPTFKTRVNELNIRALATIPILYHGNIDYYLSLISTAESFHWEDATIQLAEALGDALAQVAARRRITQTLEISEERFQNALEASQDGLWDWDLKKESFFVTPSFLYMLGYDEEFLPLNRGKISKLLPPPNNLNDFFADSNNGQGFTDKVVQFRHRRGHLVWVWVRAKQMEWDEDGNATRVIGVNVDITRFRSNPDTTAVAMNIAGTEKAATDFADKVVVPDQHTNIAAAPLTIDEALRASKVLLAEDNPINQQVATGILKRKGVKVTIVNNGQEAIDMLQSSPPDSFDLVLMDMEMPVLDGYAATRLLRDNKQFQNLPIIALTAHAREEDRKNCLSLGMNDHVAKPVKPESLYSAIAKQLEHKHHILQH